MGHRSWLRSFVPYHPYVPITGVSLFSGHFKTCALRLVLYVVWWVSTGVCGLCGWNSVIDCFSWILARSLVLFPLPPFPCELLSQYSKLYNLHHLTDTYWLLRDVEATKLPPQAHVFMQNTSCRYHHATYSVSLEAQVWSSRWMATHLRLVHTVRVIGAKDLYRDWWLVWLKLRNRA